MAGDVVGHEQTLAARGVRKGLGAYYTPSDVVEGLLNLVLDPLLEARAEQGVDAVAALRVLDPACGTGNFLVAAAERIAGTLGELGLDRSEAAGRAVRCVRGIEIDGATARLCRTNLKAIHPDGGGRLILRADALLDEDRVPAGAFDLVVGNPPFLSQLAASTTRSRDDADRLRGLEAEATALFRGRDFRPGPAAVAPIASAASWSPLLAALQDLPVRSLRTDGVIGDIADATADFRDQYYGLADAVIDRSDGAPGRPRLVTSGLIDPGRLRWGERTCRFNKTAYLHPRVELGRLAAPMQEWAARRLVPKVLVATQTRVLEAVVDTGGTLLPSVPVVTVTPRSGRVEGLWRIGALLCAPPATLVAAQRHLGSARNATALRLSASDLLALPLPRDRRAWDRAAAAFAAASGAADDASHRELLEATARAMGEAYGLGDDGELLAWWAARLPQVRAATSGP